MARTTKDEVVQFWQYWLKVCGFREAVDSMDVGGLELDYNAAYGGWAINQVMTDGRGSFGQTRFFDERMTGKELIQAMRFSIVVAGTKVAQERAK